MRSFVRPGERGRASNSWTRLPIRFTGDDELIRRKRLRRSRKCVSGTLLGHSTPHHIDFIDERRSGSFPGRGCRSISSRGGGLGLISRRTQQASTSEAYARAAPAL